MAANITPPEYTVPKAIIYDPRRGRNLPSILRPSVLLEIAQVNLVFNENILKPLENKLSSKNKEYTVRKGDSLWKIAKELLGSGSRWIEIARANELKEDGKSIIKPGDKLIIPSGSSSDQQTTPRKPISPTTTKTKSTPTLRTTNRPSATTDALNLTVARLPEYDSLQGLGLRTVPDTTSLNAEVILEPVNYQVNPRKGHAVYPSILNLYIPNSYIIIPNTSSSSARLTPITREEAILIANKSWGTNGRRPLIVDSQGREINTELLVPSTYNTLQVSPQRLGFVQRTTDKGRETAPYVYVDPNVPSRPNNYILLETLLTDENPISESYINGDRPLQDLYLENPPKHVPRPKSMDFDWRKYR